MGMATAAPVVRAGRLMQARLWDRLRKQCTAVSQLVQPLPEGLAEVLTRQPIRHTLLHPESPLIARLVFFASFAWFQTAKTSSDRKSSGLSSLLASFRNSPLSDGGVRSH